MRWRSPRTDHDEILETNVYGEVARDALAAVTRAVGDDGGVGRVAGPPGGPEAPLTETAYGQGWYLLAASELV